MDRQFHIAIDGIKSGPYTEEEVRNRYAREVLAPDALIWSAGWESWVSLSTFAQSEEWISASAKQDVESQPPPLPNPSSDFNPTAAPESKEERIRTNLKFFDNHVDCHCLECGYKGLMGIKQTQIPWYATTPSLITFGCAGWLLITIFTFGGGVIIGLLYGAGLYYFQLSQTTQIVICPQCEKELIYSEAS